MEDNELDIIIPNGNKLHIACIKADVSLISGLLKSKPELINQLDDDGCSPLGYLVNDELIWESNNSKEYSAFTVNMENENPKEIIEGINLMLAAAGNCIYNNITISKNDVLDYLDRIK